KRVRAISRQEAKPRSHFFCVSLRGIRRPMASSVPVYAQRLKVCDFANEVPRKNGDRFFWETPISIDRVDQLADRSICEFDLYRDAVRISEGGAHYADRLGIDTDR